MPEREKRTDFILRVARRGLIDRANSARAFDWIEAHKDEFAMLLDALDGAITKYNEIATEAVPAHHKSTHALRSRGVIALPSIDELCEGRGLWKFVGVIRSVNQLMANGENQPKQQPFLAFHTTIHSVDGVPEPIDEAALAIGGILHGYEEMLAASGELPEFPRDQVISALIETLAFDRESPLYDPVFSRDRLNRVDGFEDFSPEFRNEHGLD